MSPVGNGVLILMKTELADGELTVEANPDRIGQVWYLVSIGRARYVKRFNLSRAEAELLREELDRIL